MRECIQESSWSRSEAQGIVSRTWTRQGAGSLCTGGAQRNQNSNGTPWWRISEMARA
jgi:hypothetical protein